MGYTRTVDITTGTLLLLSLKFSATSGYWAHSLKIHLLKAQGFAFTGKDVTLSSIKKLPAREKQLLPL